MGVAACNHTTTLVLGTVDGDGNVTSVTGGASTITGEEQTVTGGCLGMGVILGESETQQ